MNVQLALEEFSQSAMAHPEVAGLLLYGSALWNTAPGDLDFVIVLAKPEYVHFYGVHSARGLRCEVEYVTAPLLEEYFEHPHWRADNWELDAGTKYVNGKILYDPQGILAGLRERLTGPTALSVRRYLFIHQVGQAISRLAKLAKGLEEQAAWLTAEFVRAFEAATHHARLTYPKRGFILEGWPLTPEQKAALLEPAYNPIKAVLLAEVVAQGIKTLGLDKFLAECAEIKAVLEGLPLYHLVDYGGLAEILAQVRPDLSLPADLMMTLF